MATTKKKRSTMPVSKDGVAQIELTKGAVALVDEEDADLGLLRWYLGPSGYAARGTLVGGKYRCIFLHRLVANRQFGRLAKDLQVDHKNRNRLDCRRENLRLATGKQNCANRVRAKEAFGSSQYRGVAWNKWHGKWIATIAGSYIGYFDDEREAALAADVKAIEVYGEFAILNFPPVVSGS